MHAARSMFLATTISFIYVENLEEQNKWQALATPAEILSQSLAQIPNFSAQ